MSNFTERINEVYDQATEMLHYLIRDKGVESDIDGKMSLNIPDDFQDNLERSYLSEVNEEYFVTENGLYYSYDSISMDRFCELVDTLAEEFGE